jgi:hypothetical protein
MINKINIEGTIHYPKGLFDIYDFSILFSEQYKLFLVFVMLLAMFLYIFEYFIKAALFLLFSLSMLIITFQESHGVFARASSFTAIFLIQFIACFLTNNKNQYNLRVLFSLQVIAASYSLAGFSKLYHSGFDWIDGGLNFSLQVFKNYSFLYSDTASVVLLEKANYIVSLVMRYPMLTKFFLSFSLILEFFSFLIFIHKKVKIFWGFALLGMHIGIHFFFGIGLSTIFFPMLIFFINPLYYLYLIIKKKKLIIL